MTARATTRGRLLQTATRTPDIYEQVPVRTVSETNQRECWQSRHRRRAKQRSSTALLLSQHDRPELPVVVRLTRVAPRDLDTDNLRSALKAPRDGVADWLGVDDADERVTWDYDQRRGQPRQYAVDVEVFEVLP